MCTFTEVSLACYVVLTLDTVDLQRTNYAGNLDRLVNLLIFYIDSLECGVVQSKPLGANIVSIDSEAGV